MPAPFLKQVPWRSPRTEPPLGHDARTLQRHNPTSHLVGFIMWRVALCYVQRSLGWLLNVLHGQAQAATLVDTGEQYGHTLAFLQHIRYLFDPLVA